MWSCNWLRLTKNRGVNHKMIETLLGCTPWGIQYINDVNPPDAAELLEQIKLRPKKPMVERMVGHLSGEMDAEPHLTQTQWI